MPHTRSKLARFVFDNSLLLLAGTITAVAWANLDFGSYDRLTVLPTSVICQWSGRFYVMVRGSPSRIAVGIL